jgi:hypothetical protein
MKRLIFAGLVVLASLAASKLTEPAAYACQIICPPGCVLTVGCHCICPSGN